MVNGFQEFVSSGKKGSKIRRLRAFKLILSACILALAGRIFYVQAISASAYAAYGNSEIYRIISLPALRGDIYDRNGHVLAMSLPNKDIVSDNLLITSPRAVALKLSPILGIPVASIVSTLSVRSGFVYVAKNVSDAAATKVLALGISGITEQDSSSRVDPDGTLTESIVGLMTSAGSPISGVESIWNAMLSGQSGSEQEDQSPGGVLPGGIHIIKPPIQGKGLVLSIDQSLQFQVEQDLAKQVGATNSLNGTAIVMDTHTGQILAMASVVTVPTLPTNSQITPLAKSSKGEVIDSTNPMAVTFTFEPGSVMKIATFSAALNEGVITPSTLINVPSHLLIDGSIFHDAEAHGNEILTASQVLAQSSNIGTIETAQKIGTPKLYNYLLKFGFDQSTHLGFAGESGGLLKPLNLWSGTAIGSMPIGQDIGVTPLQVLDAYNTIANGGIFVPPSVVAGTVDGNGNVTALSTGGSHRVIKSHVDSQLIGMLKGVVSSNGTAPLAAVPNYTVAGKTGTAQIPSPQGPGYLPGKYMATFVGFAPAQNPALSAIVVLDSPDGYYGGSEAGPVFSQIMQYALHLYHIAPPGAP
ncbi:MAG: penicillin-binding protein 2 [Acidimicrobiales bacterium]|nr:penicillin-binding protein 2 [Acidimicrobiales bacterium]